MQRPGAAAHRLQHVGADEQTVALEGSLEQGLADAAAQRFPGLCQRGAEVVL